MASDDGGFARDDNTYTRNESPSLPGRIRSLNPRPTLKSQDGASSRTQSTDSKRDLREEAEETAPTMIDLRQAPSQPEPEFHDEAIRVLHPSNSLAARVLALKNVSRFIAYYSPSTVTDILDAIEDLSQPDVSLHARRAVFWFLKSSASIPDLSTDDARRLFQLAATLVTSSEVELQVKTIMNITHGKHLDLLERDLLRYLNDVIRRQYTALSEARRRTKGSSDRNRGQLQEEKGLHLLLTFISTLLKGNALTISDDELSTLTQGTVYIAEKTTSKTDMKKAVEVLQTMIQQVGIPSSEIRSCIEIFCAIMNAIPDLNKLTWDCLLLLLQSSEQDKTVQILLETLALAPTDRHSHTVCGALGVLGHLVTNSPDPKLPKVEFSRFIDSLWEVHFASRRIRRDCLKTIRSLLSSDDLTEEFLQCSWDHMVQIILTATGDETYIHDRTSEPLTIRVAETFKQTDKTQDAAESTGDIALADDILHELQLLAAIFNSHWHRLSPEQRQLVGLFYYKLRLVLPIGQLRDLLGSLANEGYFSPGTSGWQNHQLEMLRLFIWDREMDCSLGCFIIQTLNGTATNASGHDLEHFHMLVLRLLNEFESKLTVATANELARFASTVWKLHVPSNLSENLQRFWPLLKVDGNSGLTEFSEGARGDSTNQVAVAFVGLFLDYFEEKARHASVLFEFLVMISKSQDVPSTVRLHALRLLFRLRCNENGNVMIIEEPDTLELAAILSRTELPTAANISSMGERSHENEDGLQTRPGRGSTMSQSSQGTLRGSLRVPSYVERPKRISPTKPLWVYPGPPGLPRFPAREPSQSLYALSNSNNDRANLRLSEWVIAIIDIIQQGGDWEVYSYVLVHIPSQLGNPILFSDAVPHIKMLRNVIGSQLQGDNFHEAPLDTSVRKGDIALCMFYAMTMLLGHSEHFARTEQDDMVRAFLYGISGWDRTPKACIQALAVACYQIPFSVSRLLQPILLKMSQIITQSQLSVDILEFLGGLARLPHMYVNFREEEYRLVFAICVRYLEHARDQRFRLSGATGNDYSSNRASGISTRSAPLSEHLTRSDVQKDLPQYVFALTHHVITVWFLSLKIADRANHVGWLTSKLVWTDHHHNEIMEEQSQVTLDMMHRTAYLDLGETLPTAEFSPSDGKTIKKSWIVGMSIVTIETGVVSGLSQLTKRQASGTTYATYQQQTAPLPPHHVTMSTEATTTSHGPENHTHIFPNHVLLQLTSTIAPTPTPMEPICLPDDEAIRRALAYFDRNDTVDGYKVGVIYIGPGQSKEAEILANEEGSGAYNAFLQGLGTKIRLKDATLNTQGLDRRDDTDGLYTYAWRDRITELVFHVPTMMPTDLEADPMCINKKRHIGNDFVKVIFNDSGQRFDTETFSSQFNYVNIVITPEAGCRGTGPKADPLTEDTLTSEKSSFTIQTITNPDLPELSPTASFKLLTLSSLPALVRHIALHTAIFSNVWVNREGGEHISSWRNRLREIAKLRERFANTGTSTSTKFPGAKATKSYLPGDRFQGRVGMGGLLEEEGVTASLDFSRWAGPNHPSA